jgi:hypothetical protein
MDASESDNTCEVDNAVVELGVYRTRTPVEQMRKSETGTGPKQRSRAATCFLAVLTVPAVVVALSACQTTDSRTYDIGPIFPLTANKCAKYQGKTEGSGAMAHCWVTKSECEKASSDWNQAMRQGYVRDAIRFSCD